MALDLDPADVEDDPSLDWLEALDAAVENFVEDVVEGDYG